jgi:hypothetical protein
MLGPSPRCNTLKTQLRSRARAGAVSAGNKILRMVFTGVPAYAVGRFSMTIGAMTSAGVKPKTLP